MARPEGNGNGCGGDPVDRFANEHATLPIPAINQNTGQQTEHEVGKTIERGNDTGLRGGAED